MTYQVVFDATRSNAVWPFLDLLVLTLALALGEQAR
jgi:hypothetical protein